MPRSAAFLPLLAAAALLLAACDPLPAPAPSDAPSASSTPKPTVTQQQAPLPADAVLGITGHATAYNGAELEIRLVVLQPQRWDATEGLTRSSATTAWCEGELDESVYSGQNWSFAQVDITAVLADGSVAWPADLPMQLFPLPGGPSIASAGSVHQVQAPDASGENDPGYYVPHCLQNAVLDGPGSGSTYLGFEADADALTAWSASYYGVTFDGVGEPVDAGRVTLSGCATVVTPLGQTLGGSDSAFPEFFEPTFCQVGSAS